MGNTPFYRRPGAGPLHPVDAAALSQLAKAGKTTRVTKVVQQTTPPSPPGNVIGTYTVAAPLTLAGNVFSIPQASAVASGYLHYGDWATFDSKEPGLGDPSTDGYVLASTAAGVRSWVPQSGGGGGSFPTPGRVYPIVRPVAADFSTWVNQGSGSAAASSGTYDDGTLWIKAPAISGGLNARLLLKPYTTPTSGSPYTLIAALQPDAYNENYFEQGIVLYSSSDSKIQWFGIRGSTDGTNSTFGMAWEQWTSPTNSTGNELFHRKTAYLSEFLWFKFVDDGATMLVWYSTDGYDDSWILMGTASSTGWHTPNYIGFHNLPFENDTSLFNPGASGTLVCVSWNDTDATPSTSTMEPIYDWLDKTFTPPAIADWTWTHQPTGATLTTNPSGRSLTLQQAAQAVDGTLDFPLITKPVPGSTPYSVEIGFTYLTLANSQASGVHVGFYDSSTGKFLAIVIGSTSDDPQCALYVIEYTSPSDAGTQVKNIAHGYPWTSVRWVKVVNDGTNLAFSISNDGDNYFQLYSQAVGTWVTPTHTILSAWSASSSTPTVMKLLHYKETA